MATATETMAIATTTLSTGSYEQPPPSSTQTRRGLFRYIPRDTIPEPNPHLYHLPPISAFADERLLPLHDIRPSLSLADPDTSSPYRLDTYGFTARRYPSRLHSAPYTRASWNDAKTLKQVYFPEVIDMVKHITGCKTVVVESAVLRSEVWTEVDGLARSEDNHKAAAENSNVDEPKTQQKGEVEDDDDNFPKLIGVSTSSSTGAGGGASPAPKVHLDFAPAGARLHIRKYHPKLAAAAREVIEAEDRITAAAAEAASSSSFSPQTIVMKDRYDGPRWALFSIWRPLKTVRRDPLALSDCRAFPMDDYVEIEVVSPELSSSSLSSSAAAAAAAAAAAEEEEEEEEGGGQCSRSDTPVKSFKQLSYLAHFSRCSPSSNGNDDDDDEDIDRHRWHWISDMQPEEVYVIQLFDSEMEKKGLGVAGGVMHSSVVLEGTGDEQDEPARESLETRVACFW